MDRMKALETAASIAEAEGGLLGRRISTEEAVVIMGAGLGVVGFATQFLASQRLENREEISISQAVLPVVITGGAAILAVETIGRVQNG